MGTPLFLLRIVRVTAPEETVILPGGGLLERDLVAACTEAIVKHGVGLFRTEAHVKAAITAGITDAINELKSQARYTLQ